MQRSPGEAGFSLVELMVVMGIMVTLTAVAMTFMADSIKISTVTNEMTEAQQNLRTAQDFIARDLVAVGDGMEVIQSPRVTRAFLSGYLTKAPATATDADDTLGVLGVVTSDDQVPSGTTVPSADLTGTIALKAASDRLTIMKIDPDFNNGATISLASGKVTNYGQTVALPSGTSMTQFKIGDIYFFTSGAGSAFGAVTGVNTGTRVLSFSAGDRYGLNQGTSTSPIHAVAGGKGSSMMRMLVTSYFLDSTGLLTRRVFGVSGGKGFTDTVVAEHVVNLQFRYFLDQEDSAGNVVAPVAALSNETQQGDVRQVEMTVTTETAHALVKGAKPQMSMTGAMSVRGMQFNEHLQPNN